MVKLASFNRAVPPVVGTQRRGLLAKVHMAPKALGMLDDDYRELLRRIAGKSSAKDCTVRQLEDVVREFERLGFSSSAAPSRPRAPRAEHPVAAKARALWISLYHLGAIGDPSEQALERFGKRQLGVDRLQWADQSLGYRLIEALKAMAERHGWSQAAPTRLCAHDRVRWLKDGLVAALLVKLEAADATPIGAVAGDRSEWTLIQLEAAGRDLGDRLRAAQANAG